MTTKTHPAMPEIYDIIKVPDPVLKETAQPIETIDATHQKPDHDDD